MTMVKRLKVRFSHTHPAIVTSEPTVHKGNSRMLIEFAHSGKQPQPVGRTDAHALKQLHKLKVSLRLTSLKSDIYRTLPFPTVPLMVD